MTGFGRRSFLRGLGASTLVPFLPQGVFARGAAPSVTELIAAHHARAGNLRAGAIGARYGLNPGAARALAGRLQLAGLSLGMGGARTAARHGAGRFARLAAEAALPRTDEPEAAE